MKLYHYITKDNTALEEGLLSLAKNVKADLHYYVKRSGQTTHAGICRWMEGCFEGRSRGVRMFPEPIKWTDKSLSLKKFVENADMFSIDIEALEKDGLLEGIYVSPSVMDIPALTEQWDCDEVLQKISGLNEIDFSPIDWSVCDDELGRRFAYVRYYLLIIKEGVIPPQYLTKEAK